ncbi:unnamed protein product [Caenorhabditis bovis]|uniref:Uncharacterized protein n=1 Tax=Caenorhabditis bovis TaxID=2654633 RepID=A0A8S1E922_9PELO|nr:unnamed protein product [Caenorhabditis bovis]
MLPGILMLSLVHVTDASTIGSVMFLPHLIVPILIVIMLLIVGMIFKCLKTPEQSPNIVQYRVFDESTL